MSDVKFYDVSWHLVRMEHGDISYSSKAEAHGRGGSVRMTGITVRVPEHTNVWDEKIPEHQHTFNLIDYLQADIDTDEMLATPDQPDRWAFYDSAMDEYKLRLKNKLPLDTQRELPAPNRVPTWYEGSATGRWASSGPSQVMIAKETSFKEEYQVHDEIGYKCSDLADAMSRAVKSLDPGLHQQKAWLEGNWDDLDAADGKKVSILDESSSVKSSALDKTALMRSIMGTNPAWAMWDEVGEVPRSFFDKYKMGGKNYTNAIAERETERELTACRGYALLGSDANTYREKPIKSFDIHLHESHEFNCRITFNRAPEGVDEFAPGEEVLVNGLISRIRAVHVNNDYDRHGHYGARE